MPIIKTHLPLESSVKNKLVGWYKAIAKQEFRLRAAYYAARMNVTIRRTEQIVVRDYKRRWGCCDSFGKLSFNWRIIQAPTEISDYVIVHELAHCHEFNHSARFWRIVANELPNYREHEAWLNAQGHSLYQI